MRLPLHRCRGIATLVLMAMLPLAARAELYSVSIDTTPLAGLSGYIAFDLVQGSNSAFNTAVISSFSSASQLGAASSSGTVSGNLQTSVTLQASTFFNEYLQAVVFAAGPTVFRLEVSTQQPPASIPDSFSLFLLNASFLPYATSDPSGASALIAIDLVRNPTPAVYTSAFSTARVAVVPEPAAGASMGAGLLALLLLCASRRGRTGDARR